MPDASPTETRDWLAGAGFVDRALLWLQVAGWGLCLGAVACVLTLVVPYLLFRVWLWMVL